MINQYDKSIQEKFQLKVTEFKKNHCFICDTPTDAGFCHVQCACAYDDYKKKMISEFLKSEEAKKTVKIHREEIIK